MACAGFGAVTLLLFGFIYWQTAGLETRRIDGFISHEYAAMSREAPAAMLADVDRRYTYDLHRLAFAAIFSAAGDLVAGDLVTLPPGLPADGRLHKIEALRRGDTGPERERARAIAGRLPNDRVLVVGRSEQDLAKLRQLVLRALELGLAPAFLAALGVGLLASRRTIVRVRDMKNSINRIMQGHLHERLPSAGSSDAIDQLALSCNGMLAEIESLVGEVKGVGDSIAHDLRTPLARLRARLETAGARSGSSEELREVVRRSIEDLDQSLGIITALLRIGEVEAGRRQAGFGQMSLATLLGEAGELYAPLAESRGLSFRVAAGEDATILGDRDLLFEAVVNLLDNAVKFAPDGGTVTLRLQQEDGLPIIRVSDSGAGISPEESRAVLERFYRAAPTRHIAGTGLGLSLVSAILRLHGFDLRMSTGEDGFSIDMICGKKAGVLL